MSRSGSILARRQLGSRLRELREAAGKTLADVEVTGIGSVSKLYRIEAGRISVRTGDVRDLCDLYGAPEETLRSLLALARATKVGGWQEDYNDVLLPGFRLYLDVEATADTIQTYDAEVIHGLLQIPDYHRALATSEGAVPEADLRRFEQLRTDRVRATLQRDAPCHLTAVIGEAALSRVIGSAEIMAAQVGHLRAQNALDHVEIRVLPWSLGAHPALRGGAFTILDFKNDADPDLVYLESWTTARYLEEEDQLREYRQLWNILAEQSTPLEEHTR